MIVYQGEELHTYVIPGQPIAWQRPRCLRQRITTLTLVTRQAGAR